MKIQIKTIDNPINFMRRAGYRLQAQNGEEQSFIRTLQGSPYPRFHAYVKNEGDELVINLHLDQRRPVYEGATAHGGDYDGVVVEEEAKRIESIT